MKATAISIILAGFLIGGAIILAEGNSNAENNIPADNASVIDGKQIIEITAKGGYFPRKSVAKAGLPTIIRFKTSGTFDCSIAVRIPSLKIRASLPPSGVTDIDLGVSNKGLLRGMCGMGMYPFEINFQS